MPLPDRPVSAADIESVWGQQIHDYTFAPAGCELSGSAAISIGTTAAFLHQDTVASDPGGYWDTIDTLIVPASGGGLYLWHVRVNSVNGSAGSGFQTRLILLLNGATIATGVEDNAGGTNVVFGVTWFGVLSAGDACNVKAQLRGGGTQPDVQIQSSVLLRIGAEFGAPS